MESSVQLLSQITVSFPVIDLTLCSVKIPDQINPDFFFLEIWMNLYTRSMSSLFSVFASKDYYRSQIKLGLIAENMARPYNRHYSYFSLYFLNYQRNKVCLIHFQTFWLFACVQSSLIFWMLCYVSVVWYPQKDLLLRIQLIHSVSTQYKNVIEVLDDCLHRTYQDVLLLFPCTFLRYTCKCNFIQTHKKSSVFSTPKVGEITGA